MAEFDTGPIPMGLSLSFSCMEGELASEIDTGEKLVKSVGKTGFWQNCNYVRDFEIKDEESGATDKSEKNIKGRKSRSKVSRNVSIASSTGSMNSEVTELSSSQFEHEKDIERKSCCLCCIL